jgi:hypothetical protein
MDSATTFTSDSENEKVFQEVPDGAVGEPDIEHEEFEQLDQGHLDDLERQNVSSTRFLSSTILIQLRPQHRSRRVPKLLSKKDLNE